MLPDPLIQPAYSLMRAVPILDADASLETAASLLRDGAPLVVVVSGNSVLGAVTGSSLAFALGEGLRPSESAAMAISPDLPRIAPGASGAEALRGFASGIPAYLVVDTIGRPLGAITPADLWPKRNEAPRPERVGGMATPFGVYLTTGAISAGARGWSLMATGALIFGLLAVAQVIALFAASYVEEHVGLWAADIAFTWLPVLLFLGAMRAIPLSGIHAAEHKVVHAIERGEELTPDIVRRMPRVHPRCGTNFAVGASIFFGVATTHWVQDEHLRLLAAFLVTLILWRPLGSLAQYWITTKEPNDRQLAMGIRSGKELLQRYAQDRGRDRSPLNRIWNSGMLHVMGGALLTYALIALVALALGFDVPL